MAETKVGDIIRYRGDNFYLLQQPFDIWVIIIENNIDRADFMVVSSSSAEYSQGYVGNTDPLGEAIADGHCEFVPANEIPDEVLAQIAKMKLLGLVQ